MVRTEAENIHRRRESRDALSISRKNERVGEGQAAALRSGLNGEIHILASAKVMRETDVTSRVSMTVCKIAGGAKLLGNRAMGNDDARNRGSVVGPNEDGRGGSGNSTMGGRNTEESDTLRMMGMIASIHEADGGILEWSIGKQKGNIVDGVGHRTVVGVSVDGGSGVVVGRSEAAKDERGVINGGRRERHGFSRKRIGSIETEDLYRANGNGVETGIEIIVGEEVITGKMDRMLAIIMVGEGVRVSGGGISRNDGSRIRSRGVIETVGRVDLETTDRASRRGRTGARTGGRSGKTIAEMRMGVCNLSPDGRMAAREGLGHNVIHETIAVNEGVARKLTAHTHSTGVLGLRDSPDNKIHLIVRNWDEGVGRRVQSFDATLDGRWSGARTIISATGSWWVAADFVSTAYSMKVVAIWERVRRNGRVPLWPERLSRSTRRRNSFPLGREITDCQIESFRLGVQSMSKFLASEELLKAPNV